MLKKNYRWSKKIDERKIKCYIAKNRDINKLNIKLSERTKGNKIKVNKGKLVIYIT